MVRVITGSGLGSVKRGEMRVGDEKLAIGVSPPLRNGIRQRNARAPGAERNQGTRIGASGVGTGGGVARPALWERPETGSRAGLVQRSKRRVARPPDSLLFAMAPLSAMAPLFAKVLQAETERPGEREQGREERRGLVQGCTW